MPGLTLVIHDEAEERIEGLSVAGAILNLIELEEQGLNVSLLTESGSVVYATTDGED